ncbi:MAG TPA: tetratricopeptide repeat protein [Polyangia bacterium]|nr:tetratricopeptide repeat protein [Polyangia bacterium]
MTYGALASTELVAECKFDDAIAQASREIAAQPDEPEAWFNRGQALTGLGRFAEAAADYEKALALDASASGLDPEAADDELFFALRNIALSQKDRPEEAIATLERYRRVLPEGRHIGDIKTWEDHIKGVEVVWVRESA